MQKFKELKDSLIEIEKLNEKAISKLEDLLNYNLELIEDLKIIDEAYKAFCEEIDKEKNKKKGTSYKEGIFFEFCINSFLWHNISKKIKEQNNG